MVNLKVRPHEREADGRVLAVTPQSAGWKYVGFEVFELDAGAVLERATGGREYAVVLLSGRAPARGLHAALWERTVSANGFGHSRL